MVIDYEIERGRPADAPRLAPAIARAITAIGIVPDAVTADRGYGQTSVGTQLNKLGVEFVAILRIGALKRQHGWGRARLRGLEGARIWCGWGAFSHNAIEIAALSN